MLDFIAGGHIAEIALAVLALEFAAIALLRRRAGRPPWRLLPTFLAGAGLLVALRFALVGNEPSAVGVALVAAFAAHVVDVARRWRD